MPTTWRNEPITAMDLFNYATRKLWVINQCHNKTRARNIKEKLIDDCLSLMSKKNEQNKISSFNFTSIASLTLVYSSALAAWNNEFDKNLSSLENAKKNGQPWLLSNQCLQQSVLEAVLPLPNFTPNFRAKWYTKTKSDIYVAKTQLAIWNSFSVHKPLFCFCVDALSSEAVTTLELETQGNQLCNATLFVVLNIFAAQLDQGRANDLWRE